MKQYYIILILTVFMQLSASAAPNITASVLMFKGQVLYNGVQISKETTFLENGLLEVKDKSYLKIKVNEYNSTFTLSANSTLKIKFNKNIKNSPFTLKNGLLRWLTKGKSKVKGFVRTKTASLAVRGTDFLIVVSSLLNETEVYCFKGKVLFQNRKDRNDKGIVKKNDWGGIG